MIEYPRQAYDDGRVASGTDVLDRQFARIVAVLRTDEIWATVPDTLAATVLADLAARDERRAATGSSVVPFRRRRHQSRRSLSTRLGLIAAGVLVAAGAAAGIGVAVSGAQEMETVALSGTALAENARAEVDLRDTAAGVEINLQASGLPPAAEGSFYQAWVKGDRGAVAIGTFHLREGAEDIALWAGVSLADYPTINVTIQSEQSGPESSGRVVLAGEVPPEFR